MSVTFYDSNLPPRDAAREGAMRTLDLESTTDLNEEITTDLVPNTADIEPAALLGLAHLPEAPQAPSNFPSAAEPAAPAPAAPRPMVVPPIREPATAPKPAVPEPAPRPALSPGTVLADRYLLEQLIGRGGTALVFRARDMQSSSSAAPNQQVAIKIPRPDVQDRARAVARLEHEFQHARALVHPGIVRMNELHHDEQHCFIAMELIQGRLLSQLVRDWTLLAPPVAHKILRSCAEALAYAHEHDVIHGDFKPANVFFLPDETVKIVDFGTACSPLEDDGARIPAATFAYASPQVLSGERPERRDDVFSFACVAYELLTGQHPFEYRSSLAARDEGRIPPRAWSLSASQWLALLSALAWERDQRPADIESLLISLLPQAPPEPQAPPVYAAPEAAVAAELPSELIAPQRSWGFFVFVACALVVTIVAVTQRRGAPESAPAATAQPTAAPTLPPADPAPTTSFVAPQPPAPAPASSSPVPNSVPVVKEKPRTKTSVRPTDSAAAPIAPASAATPRAEANPETPALSEISFEAPAIVTSESAIAAVFLIKRSQPLAGRVGVHWSAVSGTADAGIDFASSASGYVEFADGQAQRAIYVPLRNDLIKEGNEKFYVRLQSPQHARLGSIARAEATIRDDD
jgi:serine/threonine protein kinase